MSEPVVNPGTEQAAPPPKPKRPKPKSMLMIGEQTAALFENARLAKERGEKVGWSASIFPQEIAETLGLNVLYPENHAAGIAARHQADPFLQECEGTLGYSNDLCAFTGKTWDEERFKEVMKISQRNSYLWERANGLLDHKPAPIGGFELFNYMSAMVCNRGKPSTTAIMEQLNAEMEENIRLGKSTFPVEEEFRVSWDGIACWPYLSHNLRTLKKYGINMVASSYGKAWAIEYNDLDGMARAYCFASTNGDNATTMISRRMEALKRFDCEGTIYHVNRSCKVMDCQMMEVQRQLEARAGVPFTSFDGDQADYRNYSEAQFETRIQGLVEVMKLNKEAKNNG